MLHKDLCFDFHHVKEKKYVQKLSQDSMARPFHLLLTVLLMSYHTNVNLNKSQKSDTRECPLCDSDQTLMYVLNNCSVSLKTNQYIWRHNSVLAALVEYTEKDLANSWQITADLPGRVYHHHLI